MLESSVARDDNLEVCMLPELSNHDQAVVIPDELKRFFDRIIHIFDVLQFADVFEAQIHTVGCTWGRGDVGKLLLYEFPCFDTISC